MAGRFYFYPRAWENCDKPTIVRYDPAGGDPHILAVLARVYNPDALHELCRLANIAAADETDFSVPPQSPASGG
jgi:hypothetical protein